ncbi:toprim domain-containing protein [Streptomyces sp. CBMA29]|uniref:toprim domain-containing protein n=1 Tax=Streptomyces sp. CBMA29 TaxID=1896314 RepID=UPI001661C722|nr:toprim domain-containing protein [Streptomyces sp. CBMA29]MBD0734083.1 hypothetical protein [Streptomyces sp. CBMA29]
MARTRTSRISGWDLVEAHSNPVPSNLPGALADLGVTVIRTTTGVEADEHLVRCPQHEQRTGKRDRRPSCWVNDETGAFICFSCGYSGPFVELVADALGVDRVQAARWVLRTGTRRVREDRPTRAVEPQPALTEAVLALYVPPPAEALADRRLTAAACADYGVLWDAAHRRWIIPIRCVSGRLMGWQEKGRHVFRNRPTGVKKSQTLFGAHLLDGGPAALVESPLDAVLIRSLGIPVTAVSSYGAFVSDAQMRIIKRNSSGLIVALDNDIAGIKGRDDVYTRWRPRGIPMLFFNYGSAAGKDPGDMRDTDVRRAMETAHLPSRKR